jgi:pyrroloquinoline-quinone synthase
MDMTSFWEEFAGRIAKYDLLKHAFYQAWTRGELTKDDLKMYATEYYHHVDAFPEYLHMLETRLPEGKLRSAVAENREDELGALAQDKRSHSDLWVDFAEGMGAECEQVKAHRPMVQIEELISKFRKLASEGRAVEALSAFYAYESQVPRIAKEKAIGLKTRYGADAKTYKYFSVHTIADVEHARVWQDLINDEIAENPEQAILALETGEEIARGLWAVLDGVQERRVAAGAKSC